MVDSVFAMFRLCFGVVELTVDLFITCEGRFFGGKNVTRVRTTGSGCDARILTSLALLHVYSFSDFKTFFSIRGSSRLPYCYIFFG